MNSINRHNILSTGYLHAAIARLVELRGGIRTVELSEIFGVSTETIRRHLIELEGEGKVSRRRGGAVRIKESIPTISSIAGDYKKCNDQQMIAFEAIANISPGDRIILDSSIVSIYIAFLLPDFPLTVITNSLLVAHELAKNSQVEVITTSGVLHRHSFSYVGSAAGNTLEGFHVGKAFISCTGLHSDYGLTDSSLLQAEVKRMMIEISDIVYVSADHSQIGVRSQHEVAKLSDIDVLITDPNSNLMAFGETRPFQTIAAGQRNKSHNYINYE